LALFLYLLHYAETTELSRPKLNLRRMSYVSIQPKTKLAEAVQIVVFSAETEFRSVFTMFVIYIVGSLGKHCGFSPELHEPKIVKSDCFSVRLSVCLSVCLSLFVTYHFTQHCHIVSSLCCIFQYSMCFSGPSSML